MSDAPILVGDIGGTNVRFAVARPMPDGVITIDHFARLSADDFTDFNAALAAYLATLDTRPERAALALAGVIADGAVTLTNRPWRVAVDGLSARFGFSEVRLANDFEALARSVPAVSAEALTVLRPGTVLAGAPRLVAGPGTGFGMATLLASAQGVRVLPSEGGHQVFAPTSDFEWRVAERLSAAHGYVSAELVCAGVGFDDVHEAVCAAMGAPYRATAPQDTLAAARAGEPVALAMWRMKARTVYRACGNAALIVGARGGLTLCGGVSEAMADFLAEPEALSAFDARGPMSAFLAPAPITLLHAPEAPLIGAAALLLDQGAG